jgi:hypothetical protein
MSNAGKTIFLKMVWRTITNKELWKSCLAVDVIRKMLEFLGRIIKMDQTSVAKKIFESKSECSRKLGGTRMRWPKVQRMTTRFKSKAIETKDNE